MLNSAKTKLTVDEFIEEYSQYSNASSYELQDGEVIVSPEPSPVHGKLQFLIAFLLGLYADRHEGIEVLGSTNVEFGPDTCRGPDAIVMLPGSKVREEATKLVGPPALIVEIVSPSHPHLDLIKKRSVYTTAKVGEIWFIDSAEKEALFLSRVGSKYVEQSISHGVFDSRVLKGLKLDVSALFDLNRRQLRKTSGL